MQDLGGCREFLSVFALVPECSLGLALELPDPLAGHLELLAQVGERGRLLTVQAVATNEDAALALGEPLDGLHKAACLQLPHHLGVYSRLALVLDEIAELRAALVGGERLVEAGSVGY